MLAFAQKFGLVNTFEALGLFAGIDFDMIEAKRVAVLQ